MAAYNKPLVSFVVPNYNYARYLPDCLGSIFAQEGNYDIEVIIIDDGSTDNTREILANFSDARLTVAYHNKNLGHASTINEGLNLARGEFIARIDPDDRYRKYFLSSVLDKFYAFPEVGLVYGDAALINESGNLTAERSDRIHRGKDFKGNEFIKLLEVNFICSPTVIARREAWQKALPVPEKLAFHDWYFTLMMARQYDFYYINRVIADYRVHPQNYHDKILREGRDERSVFWLLGTIFREKERVEKLDRQKHRAKRRIYGAQYFTLADKYFVFLMNEDARRCYLQAIKYRPIYMFRFSLLRRIIATYIGRDRYERCKSFIKPILRLFLRR